MNERIRELVKRTGFTESDLAHGRDEMLWEFALLILKECISVVDDAERGGSNEIWDNAVKFIRKDIKQHFGVEE